MYTLKRYLTAMIFRDFWCAGFTLLGLAMSPVLVSGAATGSMESPTTDEACPAHPVDLAMEMTWSPSEVSRTNTAMGAWGRAFEHLGAARVSEARELLAGLSTRLPPSCAEKITARLDLDRAATAYEAGELEHAWRFARSARRQITTHNYDPHLVAASWLVQGEVALEWGDAGLAVVALLQAVAQTADDQQSALVHWAATVRLSEAKEQLGALREARALARTAQQAAATRSWRLIEERAARVLRRTRAQTLEGEPHDPSALSQIDSRVREPAVLMTRDLELIVDLDPSEHSPTASTSLRNAVTLLEQRAPRSLALARGLAAMLASEGLSTTAALTRQRTLAWNAVRSRCDAAIDASSNRYCQARYESVIFTLLVATTEAGEIELAFRISQAWSHERKASARMDRWPLSPPCSPLDRSVDKRHWREASQSMARALEERQAVALTAEDARRWGASWNVEYALAARNREAEATWRHALEDWSSLRLDADNALAESVEQPLANGVALVDLHDDPRTGLSGETLLAYVVGEEKTLLFVVPSNPRSPIVSHLLPHGRAGWQRRSEEFRTHLLTETVTRSISVAGRSTMDWWGRAVRRELLPVTLTSLLLRPSTRLLIEPDGPLWSIPFGALVLNDQGPPVWLGATVRLSLVYDLLAPQTALVKPAKRAQLAAKVLLVGATRRSDYKLTRSRRSGQRLRFSALPKGTSAPQLADLPGARVEIDALASLYDVRVRPFPVGIGDGSIDELLDAQLIHFATHGVFESGPAALSYLLVDRGNSRNHIDLESDQRLEAWEISCSGGTHAQLVVLAACDSAPRGFDPLKAPGLAEAFLESGARSVLSSMWPVADAASSKFMLAFHRSVKLGVPFDEALRRTVAEHAAAPFDRSPVRWAGFVLVGRSGILVR